MSRRLLLTLPLLLAACSDRPSFDPEVVKATPLGKGLPSGFMLGTSTAAHQIEGGLENDWAVWERGQWPDGAPAYQGSAVSGAATNSWNRFDEDVRLMERLGSNAYRFSIEWARLQPTPDTWDEAALERYRQWAHALRQKGITPLVTLYHFTLPTWVWTRAAGRTPPRWMPSRRTWRT